MFRNWRDLLHAIAAWSVFTILFVASLSPSRIRYIFIGLMWLMIVGIAAYFQRRNARVHDGWHYLSPGPLEWLRFVVGSALSAFSLWTYHYVESATIDPDWPLLVFKLLVAGMVALTAAACFMILSCEWRWNEFYIEQRRSLLSTKRIRLSQIVAIGVNHWTHYLWIAASDNTVIRFSPYSNGAEELIETILQSVAAKCGGLFPYPYYDLAFYARISSEQCSFD